MKHQFTLGAITVLVSLGLAACQPIQPPAPASPPGSESEPTRSMPSVPEELVIPTPVPPTTGEAPDALLRAILADASERTGLPTDAFTVYRAEEVIWNDGSLGCGTPGAMYIQQLVSGYWIVLQSGDLQLDYRANDRGYFFLCENPQPRPPAG